ncbi:MAG TPA: sigma 54-interacting transcriptional regulator, partial [Burkholderiaceae bacterium]
KTERTGRFQTARGGTLFLDEIGNTTPGGQAKLLAALERRRITPVGSDRSEPVDVRIVAATNLSEQSLYDSAVFRQDLLFRLNTVVIRVPPLRERVEDIAPLLTHYLEHYRRQYQKPVREIEAHALQRLCGHSWPGNIRSLRHACERAVIFATRAQYRYDDFGLIEVAAAPVASGLAADAATLDALERVAIVGALDKVQGNISRAAKLLGVSRTALYRKLDKHGL